MPEQGSWRLYAEIVGYKSEAAFSRAFKKAVGSSHYGAPPRYPPVNIGIGLSGAWPLRTSK
jgi:hypothetical protein